MYPFEKKYKEAEERAKKALLKFRSLSEGQKQAVESALKEVFPDLEESNDERIRKEIIGFIQSQIEDGNSAGWDRWIAYLERQKEQKPSEKQDYSGLTDFERAIHRGFLCAGVENVPVTIIKETAQDCLAHIKPVELKYWDKEMIQSIISILERDNCFKVVDEKPMRIFAHEQEINYLRNLQEYLYPNPHWKPSEKQKEQKLAWSKEDKQCLDTAIAILENLGYDGVADNLKHLRPHSKQEWSEEDERKLEKLSFLLTLSEVSESITPTERTELGTFLKSLRSLRFQPKQNEEEFEHLVCELVTDIVANEHMPEGERKPTAFFVKKYTDKFSSQPHWKKSLATADLENALCEIQDKYNDQSREYRIIGEAIEFIRSTEPQWRPSDEQMRALGDYIDGEEISSYDIEEIVSLYNNLRNL